MRNRRPSIRLVLTLTVVGLSLASQAPAAVAGPRVATDRIWVARYISGEFGQDVAASHDGARVFATGSSVRSGVSTFGTVAYDTPTGTKVWAAQYPDPRGGNAVALAVSPDDDVVYVTGSSVGSASYLDYVTVAYQAATGTQLWVARYAGAEGGADEPLSLVVSPDGTKVFVTGRSSIVTNDYLTVAYDAANGAQLWTARYDGPSTGSDVANAIGVSADGRTVYVTGDSPDLGLAGVATIAYDASDGSTRWVTRFHGGAVSAQANDLAVAPDGRLFVTGMADGAYTTDSYDAASGTLVWTRAFHGPGSGDDIARSVGVSPDGSLVYVTGTSSGFTGRDFGTIAYAASTGATAWMNLFNSPGDRGDDAEELAVAPDGYRVFVTGGTAGLLYDQNDYATVTISATTGQRLRVDVFDGAGSFDHAYGITVAPDSSAFYVIGTSARRLGSAYIYDYATVAYRT